jgi:MinD-like ATPase involved in chromosome partitioning or flagellar assembly
MTTIIALHSFSHGAGKSSLCANLSLDFTKRGRRVAIVTQANPAAVQLEADSNKTTASLFELTNLDPRVTLTGYLDGYCQLADTWHDVSKICQAEASPTDSSDSSLHLIFLGDEIATTDPAENLQTWSQLSDTLGEISQHLELEYLFLDIAPGLAPNALVLLSLTDILVVLLRPESEDYQGTAVLLDVAKQLDIDNTVLVLNQVLPQLDFQVLQDQIEETYQIAALGVIPIAEELKFLSLRELSDLQYVEHPYSQAIQAIADKLYTSSQLIGTKTAQDLRAGIFKRKHRVKRRLDMLNILALPDEERQLMNWLVREGGATLEEIQNHTGQDAETVLQLMASLIDQGLLQSQEFDGTTFYKP